MQNILRIIDKHNDVVKSFADCDTRVSAKTVLALMPFTCKLASLGLEITHQARALGIDAKCCMQSGEINVSSNSVMATYFYDLLATDGVSIHLIDETFLFTESQYDAMSEEDRGHMWGIYLPGTCSCDTAYFPDPASALAALKECLADSAFEREHDL